LDKEDHEVTQEETIDTAVIEIIAPVLKEGNYKWKGIYDGLPISFWMIDAEFKNSVFQKQLTFQHGSCINCVFNIQRKFNEIGEVKITGYICHNRCRKN
jgi:hypothetical protein